MEQNIQTLEEAFERLSPGEQAHARRVAAYCEAAFARVVAMDLYISEPRGNRELIGEHKPLARLSGLYHDIGKAVDRTEHTQAGAELFARLDPEWKKRRAVHQRMLLDGIRDHHRPEGEESAYDVPYMGRIVAIADRLDHRAMELRSEDPIAQALDELRPDAKAGLIDPEFYRAFRSARAKLKRIFEKEGAGSAALPTTQPWIRRKAGRPMELWYRRTEEGWQARMTFRMGKEIQTYEQVRRLINANRLGLQMGDYFLYEACDAIHRFENCGIPCPHMAVELPGAWLGRKGLKKQLLTILADEGLAPERLILLSGEEASSKTEAENRADCQEAGVRWKNFEEYETFAHPSGVFMAEDAIVQQALHGESGVSG